MPIKRFEPTLAVEIISPGYGSGYRIGGRLVLTAKHLLGEVGSSCKVRDKRSSWEDDGQVVWIAPGEADVALLKLSQAIEACDSIVFGRLPMKPPAEKLRFDSYGWPQWARTTYPDQPDLAGGRHIDGVCYLADRSPEKLLVLEPERKPDSSQLSDNRSPWEGISGAAVVCNGFVVAVHHHHQQPNRASSLEATPLWPLFEEPSWCKQLQDHGIPTELQDVLPRAIPHETRQMQAIGAITDKLNRLEQVGCLKKVAEAIRQLGGGESINPNDKQTRANLTAVCIVQKIPVIEVIRNLASFFETEQATNAETIADIVNDLLPLNYFPSVVQRLRQSLNERHFSIVVDEKVSTWTLAEILAAAYDEKPAEFTILDGVVRGRSAIAYAQGPEVGPGEIGDESSGLLPTVRDVLSYLIERLDVAPRTAGTDVVRTIDSYVAQLQGVLTARRHKQRQRTLYYVLTPQEDAARREFLAKVLGHVREKLPQLLFVELAQYQQDPEESEIEDYIQTIQMKVRAQITRQERS
jgi:hypothetical protein